MDAKSPATRYTRQKSTIIEQLRKTRNFVSARDLHRSLAESGSNIGLATVYRRINALSEDGLVDTIRFDGQRMFRLCVDEEHHHHLICEKCGKTIDIEPPEQWIQRIVDEYGFTVSSHTVEVFGLCPDCQKVQR